MPKLALDTSAYIAYVQNDTAVTKFVDRASSIGLPIIVIGELYFGIFDGSKSEQNSQKLNRLLASPRVEILNVDETSARIFGEISTVVFTITGVIWLFRKKYIFFYREHKSIEDNER